MQIITSALLFDKYPGKKEEIMTLLQAISSNVNILPLGDYSSIKSTCDKILNESICLVGNNDIVEFASLNNPATDNDGDILSDNPYITTVDRTYLIPDKGRSIGRIPDEGINPTFDYLEKVLTNQANWMKNKSENLGWFGLVNQAWNGIGQYMKNQFNMNGGIYIAPPAGPDNIKVLDTVKKFSWVNLHGGKSVPNYYSQNTNGTYPIALTPTDNNFEGCLPFIESCFGGWVVDRSRFNSIPLNALYYNAIGTISSSSTSYGPSSPPSQAIDLLAECFFQRILLGNTTIGEAFTNAKIDMATRSIKEFGSLSGAARKTLIQTLLYASPDIKI